MWFRILPTPNIWYRKNQAAPIFHQHEIMLQLFQWNSIWIYQVIYQKNFGKSDYKSSLK